MPTPVSGLLLCHEVIALDTRHHRQVLGKQRRIQFNRVHRQLVGNDVVTGILITSHEEQFGAYVIEGMEIPCPAQHLSCPTVVWFINILLSEIGQQFVAVIEAVGHVKRYVLPIALLVTIGGIGIDIGAFTAI